MSDLKGFFALDTNALAWEVRANPHLPQPIFRKLLHIDEETGELFQLVRYPRGVVNPSHTHPCAHAMLVLEGVLSTHKGRFAAGSFLWFPEGEVMWHGATAEQDVIVLLVSNKPFSIHYSPSSTATREPPNATSSPSGDTAAPNAGEIKPM